MTNKSSFKQTAVGEIPKGWELKQLQDVAKFTNGYAFSSKSYVDVKYDAVPIFKMGNINIGGGLKITGKEDYSSRDIAKQLGNYLTRQGDILMCMTDMKSSMNLLGHSAQIHNEKFLVNQRVGIIRYEPNIDGDFFYYFLNSPDYIKAIRTTARSGVQVNLTTEAIRESSILYPPILEQRQIASILSSLDDKIELNRKMNKTLEDMAKALFKHWFVDFEFPNEEGNPYKSSGGEMIESELGPIPMGWENSSLADIAEYLNGLPMQKYPQKTDNYLPVIKIRELKSGVTDTTDKADCNIPAAYVVKNGDILFSWSGSLEVVVWCDGKGALNQHLFKVTSDKYPKWFNYYWLLYHLTDFKDIAANKATTMGHIQRHHLTEKKVLIPMNDVMMQMDQLMDSLFQIVVLNKIQSIELNRLRDSLLPKLMSGKTRVN